MIGRQENSGKQPGDKAVLEEGNGHLDLRRVIIPLQNRQLHKIAAHNMKQYLAEMRIHGHFVN